MLMGCRHSRVALTPQMMSPVPTIPSTVRPIPSDHGIQQEEDLVEVRIVRGSFEERGNYFIGMRILGYPGKVRTETVKETNEPEWGNYKAEFAIPANEGAKLTPNTKLVLEFGCFFSSKVMPRPTLIGVHQLYLDTVAPQLLYGKTVPIVTTFCNAKDTVGTVSVLMYYPHADKFSLALGFDRLQVCESFHSRVYSLRKLNEVDYTGCIRPDHAPKLSGEHVELEGYGLQGHIFTAGYLRGLLTAVGYK